MKYQLGDRIVILHSGEEGKVVDFIDQKMVLVDVQGVTFPVFLDQIDFPYFHSFMKKGVGEKPLKPEKKTIEDIRPEKGAPTKPIGEGILLSMLPVFDKDVFDEDVVDYFRVSIINSLPLTVAFVYRLYVAGQVSFELSNHLQPGSDLYLHDVSLEDMNGSPRFTFELSLPQKEADKAGQTQVQHRVKAKQLFADLEEMQRLNQAHFTYLLLREWPAAEKELPDIGLGKLTSKFPSHHRKSSSPPQTVIDLHIERLAQDWRSLQPHEILSMQLEAFERAYDAIVEYQQPMLTVIHGVGKGVLRDEIHEILRTKKHVSSFIHQYHPLFGYGATEILLRY